jgi:DNA-binding NtrC family response regulator
VTPKRDVLIVDDDEEISSVFGECLRIEGYSVRIANNGQHGLACLDDRLPDAVVLDVEMPVLDGPGMASRMAVLDRGRERIPVVLVSAAPDLPAIQARLGTPYAVSKPFDLETVLGVLERAIAERRAPTPSG